MCIVGSIRPKLLWMPLKSTSAANNQKYLMSVKSEFQSHQSCTIQELHAGCSVLSTAKDVFYHLDIYFSSQLPSILLCLDKRPVELLDIIHHPFHLQRLFILGHPLTKPARSWRQPAEGVPTACPRPERLNIMLHSCKPFEAQNQKILVYITTPPLLGSTPRK